jgi:putative OPT family oligopeptide transporter
MSAASAKALPELTLRGLLLGIGLTFIFTAANIYLGLKVGLTFASSIPAAVISMAVLGFFPRSNIRENNIVQTVASAAGVMASIIFILPGLVIVGWWTGFPFWTSFLVCTAGGVLGVLFTIPLRRALVTHSDLPYPEGVAAAEILRVGAASGTGDAKAREGLHAIIFGALASTGFAVLSAMRVAAGEAAAFFRIGGAATGFNFSYSLALLGAGHLVGISVGTAMLLGLLITWGGLVPLLTIFADQGTATLADFVTQIWRTQVRFIGAGTMGVAAIWSLLRLTGPVMSGLAQVVRAQAAALNDNGHTDRDIPVRVIALLVVLCLAAGAILVWAFASNSVLSDHALTLAILSIPIVLIGGFLVAAICGYMAGLIGSSNSPVSGVGILGVTGCAVALIAVIPATLGNTQALVACALFITSILLASAVSSNDNLQDLKTGQLVGAAPWRQQIALIIGVVASSAVIPFILNLLARAYGFAGAPNTSTITNTPLAAPQANLLSSLAQGVIGHHLDWNLIGWGALIGIGVVIADEILRAKKWMRLPPLGVGLAIYLPMSVTAPLVAGAFIGWWYNKQAEKSARPDTMKRLGVLAASGMIVGESLFGVLVAGLIVGLNSEAPFALVPADFAPAGIISLIAFVAFGILLYAWLFNRRKAVA